MGVWQYLEMRSERGYSRIGENTPKILSRKEWTISHGFIFFGLICLSIAIWLSYLQPTSNLLIFGLWFLFGGICYAVPYLTMGSKRLGKIIDA